MATATARPADERVGPPSRPGRAVAAAVLRDSPLTHALARLRAAPCDSGPRASGVPSIAAFAAVVAAADQTVAC